MKSPDRLMVVVKREAEKLATQRTLERLAAYNKALSDTFESRGVKLSQPGFDF